MARRYFARPLPTKGPATLSPRLGHHLGRIVRARPGDSVVLFDGLGSEVAATILEVDARELQVDIGMTLSQPLGRSPRLELHVACALPKKPRTDWLLEHGTELGISSFRPILTSRTNRQAERRGHWQRVLIAAAAQCDRLILPTIEATVSLQDLCAMPLPEARFVATTSAAELGPGSTREALLVVGPEGGLSDEELDMLAAAGFQARSLGPLTLRTETAVLAGATRLLQAPCSGSD